MSGKKGIKPGLKEDEDLTNQKFPVIAVGALGGSGTRVIAEIMEGCGIYIGDDLNIPKDNLIFTRLFKDPAWYSQAGEKDFKDRLALFERYMTQSGTNFSDYLSITGASFKNRTFPTRPRFYLDFPFRSILAKKEKPARWGWKEPNTQIYIPQLLDFFPNLKYVHVARHGLDMAFSENLQQLTNWGETFGIKENGKPVPVRQLDYWILTNQRALELSRKFPSGSFLYLNYDVFCANPKIEVPKLVEFFEAKVSEKEISRLISLPKVSSSTGRYLKNDCSIFSKEQIKAVEDLGFPVLL